MATKNEQIFNISSEVDELEPVMQSEVSWKEKNKCSVLTHIYELWENSSDEAIYREEMETQT